jgi:transposase
LRVRQERSRPLIVELEAWLREQRTMLSRNNETTKAINYCLSRWDAFTRFLDDGRPQEWPSTTGLRTRS